MPQDAKKNAIECLDAARSLVGDGPTLELGTVKLVQLRSFIETARECVGQIEELKVKRRTPRAKTPDSPF